MKKRIIDKRYAKLIFETPNDGYSYWFGYYNYDPLNISGTKVLCNKASFDGREISKDDFIELGWFDINNNSWHKIGISNSFNWQQGSMLQWLPYNDHSVVYNNSLDNTFCSFVFNTITGEEKKFVFPVYAILPNGKKALCLNYERSYWCRAYHYKTIANPKYNVSVADDDGVYELDLETNSLKRIISIDEVINLNYNSEFANASHWLEHIMINKEGTRGVFLHRYSLDNVLNYKTRIISFDIDGTNLKTILNQGQLQWSHIGWLKEDEFIAYSVTTSNRNSTSKKLFVKTSKIYLFLRKIYYKFVRYFIPSTIKRKFESPGCYRIYKIAKDGIVEIKTLNDIGEIDGHPSVTNDREYMITDTYPDLKRMQHLYVYSLKNCKKIKIGSFFAYYKGNPASCDLHPKLSRDNKYLMIDTAYDSRHHFMILELDWEKIRDDLS